MPQQSSCNLDQILQHSALAEDNQSTRNLSPQILPHKRSEFQADPRTNGKVGINGPTNPSNSNISNLRNSRAVTNASTNISTQKTSLQNSQ